MNKEWMARFIILVLVIAAIIIPLAAWRSQSPGTLIHGQMAETGGWTPGNLTAEVGKPFHIRLTSDDVTHGFAVGQSVIPPVDVKPGEISEVTLTFDKPGKYTFYCTRWCSVNHWRMRGTIEVKGGNTASEKPVALPLYVRLGLDIDAVQLADVIPEKKPSALRGESLVALYALQPMITRYQITEYYLAHSPVEIWKGLRAAPETKKLSDQDIWDLVAFIWRSEFSPQDLQEGKRLFTTNCVACHGENGAGDGVFAAQLANSKSGEKANMNPGAMTVRPADFTNPNTMLSASSARLQGKILRGGMGTGMPYWGPILTEDQTWDLVDYLWAFQFDLEDKP